MNKCSCGKKLGWFEGSVCNECRIRIASEVARKEEEADVLRQENELQAWRRSL